MILGTRCMRPILCSILGCLGWCRLVGKGGSLVWGGVFNVGVGWFDGRSFLFFVRNTVLIFGFIMFHCEVLFSFLSVIQLFLILMRKLS
jgi:hypothetical protein